jgi:HEAT repeat protein
MKALWGINRYASRTSEDRRRDLAFRFSGLGSPLAKEELIAALRDPSFDVRQEAISALGHIGRHPAVVRALEEVLEYQGLVELRYEALRSLGRLSAIGSAPRVAALLDDAHPMLRASAARALGEMGHAQSLPRIREMLAGDDELDCRLAAASALGKLKDRESLTGLVALYLSQAADIETPVAEPRGKVVLLAITKILRCEEDFAHQWRREEAQPGLAVPGLLLQLGRLPTSASRELRALAPEYDPHETGAALRVLTRLAPDLDALARPDAQAAARVLRQVGDLRDPHPALVVALGVIALRVLGR